MPTPAKMPAIATRVNIGVRAVKKFDDFSTFVYCTPDILNVYRSVETVHSNRDDEGGGGKKEKKITSVVFDNARAHHRIQTSFYRVQ